MGGASIIRITTESELNSIQKEAFINKTTKVTKVADNSVLSGIAVGNAKVAKKALKDISLAVAHLFPNNSSGIILDTVSDNHGIANRLVASQSSTYVRLVATDGTVYTQGTQTFSGVHGVVFDLVEATVTVGTKGFAYAKVRSQNSGEITNIDPYTISTVTSVPSGHIGLINEYRATGGRDAESDELFKKRIKEGPNQLSQGTLTMLAQAFITINPDILKINFEGIDGTGKVVLGIVTQNGIDLTVNELNTLLQQGNIYFSLTDMQPIGSPPEATSITLKNTEYENIDVDFRFEMFDASKLTATVKEIQISFSKLVDFRFWDSAKDIVQRSDLISIIKTNENVKYLPDVNFIPTSDLIIPNTKLPRFRGFIARDLLGAILINQAGTIDPVFYPNSSIINLQQSVL